MKPTETELRRRLTEEQYRLTQQNGTERAFNGAYDAHFEPGIHAGVASGNPLLSSIETAILAGGCFWGMQEILRSIDGVIETRVGYCGGTLPDADYEAVKRGDTGHAESVKVVFHPGKLPFRRLLTDWFFRMHDPTKRNRQGNDIGENYRSTIFYCNKAQKAEGLAAIRETEETGRWPAPIATTVEPVNNWSDAEEYHQDYLQKNPGGYTCHWLRDWE